MMAISTRSLYAFWGRGPRSVVTLLSFSFSFSMLVIGEAGSIPLYGVLDVVLRLAHCRYHACWKRMQIDVEHEKHPLS